MSDKCISGRHDYEHLGISCDEVDEQWRVAREISLRSGTSIVSGRGPVWSVDGDSKDDVPAIPDGVSDAGEDIYGSGSLGTARDDDAQDA